MKEFRGDPKRLYLTGLSMGGFGSIAFAAKRAGQFAAVVPICGGVLRRGEQPPPGDPYAEAAAKIGKTPVWLFHGGADPTVPVTESRKMEAALKAAGGDVRYTEYPGVGHNSWDKAYAEVDMAKWLFEQRLK
jgi:predicted peptidase